jgi:hypothetical protein
VGKERIKIMARKSSKTGSSSKTPSSKKDRASGVAGKPGAAAAGSWPSVAEQLAGAKVIPGSALEKLIRENQDFEMLGKGDVDELWSLPPWFKVYWRKKHPEINFKGPPVADSRIMQTLYEWMLQNQDLSHDLVEMKPSATSRK